MINLKSLLKQGETKKIKTSKRDGRENKWLHLFLSLYVISIKERFYQYIKLMLEADNDSVLS